MRNKIAKQLRRLSKEEYPFEPKTGEKAPEMVFQKLDYLRDIRQVTKEKKTAYKKLNRNQRHAFNHS